MDRAANYFVIDAASGKTVLTRRPSHCLPPAARTVRTSIPSLCLAGKHLFLGNDAGETMLLEPGDRGTVVGMNTLPGGSGGTPTFRGHRMFVRGGERLYCVGVN